MVERLSPYVALLLNEYLMGFVPLFSLVFSTEGRLPQVGPWLVALTIWSIPDIVWIVRAGKSEAQAARLFRAIHSSILWAHLALWSTLLVFSLIHQFIPALVWGFGGFGSFVVAKVVQAQRLRRHLNSLAVLDG